ncbi:MAG: hypothetical protein Q7S11_00745 [bacterium]|nr:hypothetical protein [bacterium]
MDYHVISSIALWAPRIVIPALLVFTTLVFLRNKEGREGVLRRRLWILSFLTIVFMIGYSLLLTFGQHAVWQNGTELTKFLVTAPVSTAVPFPSAIEFTRPFFNHSGGYFMFYVLGRFWLRVGILLLVSFAFYAFLRLLRNYRGHFFAEGEMELGLLCALLSGWPGVLVFIPGALFYTVIMSMYRLKVLKESRTTLGISFLLSVMTIFVLSIFGDPTAFFHISALKV